MRTPSEHEPIPTIRHGVFLSKQLEPLVYNKTPRRHAATTFIFIFFFNMTPQISPYGGEHINYTPKSTFHAPPTTPRHPMPAHVGTFIRDKSSLGTNPRQGQILVRDKLSSGTNITLALP